VIHVDGAIRRCRYTTCRADRGLTDPAIVTDEPARIRVELTVALTLASLRRCVFGCGDLLGVGGALKSGMDGAVDAPSPFRLALEVQPAASNSAVAPMNMRITLPPRTAAASVQRENDLD
jgi:hypothetical protein